MTDSYKTVIQVQPRFHFLDEWEILAARENLSYEVLDFSTQPALNESGLFEEYLESYVSYGRNTSIHGCFIDVNPGSGDPAFRELSRKRCMESCEAAVALGAENVVFHSSCFPFLRGVYLDAWAQRCIELYEELVDKYDINIFIENSQDIDAGPIKELMNRTKDKRIRVCLDIGHAHYSHIPVRQWFEELGEWISYLHLSDNMGTYDDHLPLGEGTVDWEETDRLWKDLKRDTHITIEVNGLESTANAVRFLKGKRLFGLSEDN